MKLNRFFFAFACVSMLATGCSHESAVRTKTTIEPAKNPTMSYGATVPIVILPFSDYSAGWTPDTYYRRNSVLHEELSNAMYSRGFSVAVDEDVTSYLFKRGIIRLQRTLPKYHMHNNEEVTKAFSGVRWEGDTRQDGAKWHDFDKSKSTVALDRRQLSRLGKEFNSHYIVRGRILEYQVEDSGSYDISRVGIIPFILNGATATLFGTASSKDFDVFNGVASGIGVGALVGELFDDGATKNMWWMIGGAAGYLAKHSGKVQNAVLSVRIAVQDASTGQIIWTNQAEVEATPLSIYSSATNRQLFREAAKNLVAQLLSNFDAGMLNNRLSYIENSNRKTVENKMPAKHIDTVSFNVPHQLRDGYNSTHDRRASNVLENWEVDSAGRRTVEELPEYVSVKRTSNSSYKNGYVVETSENVRVH